MCDQHRARAAVFVPNPKAVEKTLQSACRFCPQLHSFGPQMGNINSRIFSLWNPLCQECSDSIFGNELRRFTRLNFSDVARYGAVLSFDSSGRGRGSEFLMLPVFWGRRHPHPEWRIASQPAAALPMNFENVQKMARERRTPQTSESLRPSLSPRLPTLLPARNVIC